MEHLTQSCQSLIMSDIMVFILGELCIIGIGLISVTFLMWCEKDKFNEICESENDEYHADLFLIYGLLRTYFKGDEDRINLWMSTPNLLLGNQIPDNMLKVGKSKKLLCFVQSNLEENTE